MTIVNVRVFHTTDTRNRRDPVAWTPVVEVFRYTVDLGEVSGWNPGSILAVADGETGADHYVLDHAYYLLTLGHRFGVPNPGVPDPRALAYRQRGNRGLSTGDVVAVDERYYQCVQSGEVWEHLAIPPAIDPARALPGTVPFVPPSSDAQAHPHHIVKEADSMNATFAGTEVGNRIDYLFDLTDAPKMTKSARTVQPVRARIELTRYTENDRQYTVEWIVVYGTDPDAVLRWDTLAYAPDQLQSLAQRALNHANSRP